MATQAEMITALEASVAALTERVDGLEETLNNLDVSAVGAAPVASREVGIDSFNAGAAGIDPAFPIQDAKGMQGFLTKVAARTGVDMYEFSPVAVAAEEMRVLRGKAQKGELSQEERTRLETLASDDEMRALRIREQRGVLTEAEKQRLAELSNTGAPLATRESGFDTRLGAEFPRHV